jgi:hypothetical protein
MAYQVEYQDKVGYLYVHVKGKRSLDAVIALAREVTEKATSLGQKLVLLDVREFEGWLQIMDSSYVVNAEFPKLRGTGLEKVAILDHAPEESTRWFFFETYARNRGFNILVSLDLQSALAWLLEGVDIEE